MKLLAKLKPIFWDHTQSDGVGEVNYRRMWEINFTVAALVTLLPLLLMAGVAFYHLDRLVKMERRQVEFQVKGIMACTRLRMGLYLDRYLGAMRTMPDPARQGAGGSAKVWYTGLTLLGPDGSLAAEQGQRTKLDAQTRGWLARESSAKGRAVRLIRAGEREQARLVLAIKHETSQGDNTLVAAMGVQALKAVAAAALGELPGKAWLADPISKLRIPLGGAGTKENPSQDQGTGRVLRREASVPGSPLVLLTASPLPGLMSVGEGLTLHLILFVSISVLVMLAVVYKGTVGQVTRLYHSHVAQSKVLREVAYTHKLASVGRLAAGVAHQINNPMAVINEKAGLIKDLLAIDANGIDEMRLRRLTDDISVAAKGAGAITHRLLGFARHLPMEIGPVLLDQLLRELVGFLTHDAEYRPIEVSVDIESQGRIIQSDQSLLEQAFFNIINNAVSAVGEGGRIDITLGDGADGFLEVRVIDNGPGIPSENLKHIFEPYYSTKSDLGSGLGLSITHGIVHKLGGRIEITSQEGIGTQVLVALPASTPGGSDAPESGGLPEDGDEEARTEDEGQDQQVGVLIVDDDADYLEIVSERLGMRGFKIDSATDGLDALAKLRKNRYTSVVLDMMMPGLGGMEMLKKIRDQYPHTQVILQSGYTTAELQAAAAQLGAAALLEKPVDLDLLSQTILSAHDGEAEDAS